MSPASKKTKGRRQPGVDLEAELGELYGRALEEFTAYRDEIVKRLRESGERKQAAAVARLKKPSLSAWAVNQAVRDNPKAAKRLIDAGEQLEAAQDAVLRGSDRAGLRAAMAEEQGAVEAITDAAGAALEAAGRASATTLDRVRKTLRAVAGNDGVGGELAQGRVTNDREAVGFGVASAMPTPRRRSDSKPDAKRRPDPKAGSEAKRRSTGAAEKKRRQATAEKKRRQAGGRAVKNAQAKLDAASKRVAAAQTRLDCARATLDQASAKLDTAERERGQREDELAAAKDAF